ncbi:MAG: type II CAAX prenyl endopeptidase Rce1 family protein [Promethearchaeota archaeon]
MSKDNKRKIKYCVYCGSDIEEGKIYCPKCGKLVIKLEPSKKIPKPPTFEKVELSRKCPGCGSMITSTILDQCPICNTTLEKLSEVKKAAIQKKPGLIFTSKKLEPEQKFLLKKDSWNLREGINVFGTCIYVLVIAFFLIFTFISFEMSIQLIILSQIPELLFGIYPIYYILRKKHSFNKLGFFSDSKKIIIAVLIGILGSLVLLLVSFFSDSLINFISDAGLDFFDIKSSIENQNLLIRNADLLWIILLTISIFFRTIFSEIVFRGVLHNTLKQKFKNEFYVILLVALIYSLVMLLFSFPVGVSFILLNFLSFVVLGLLYSLNGNIYNTIIANISYNVIALILIFL